MFIPREIVGQCHLQVLIRDFPDFEKPFSFSEFAALSTKEENEIWLFNVREGSDYPRYLLASLRTMVWPWSM